MAQRARVSSSVRHAALAVFAAAAALGLSLACSGGQSGTEDRVAPGAEDPVGPDRGGECEQDLECQDGAASQLERLAQPAPVTVEISASRCEHVTLLLEFGSIAGNVCTCDRVDGGVITVGPPGGGCSVIGRNGQCLFGDNDYTACDYDDPDGCSAICDAAAKRIEADSQRPIETELLLSACRQGTCRRVASLDGQCYADDGYARGQAFDCSLGAEGVLQASADAQALPVLTPVADDATPYRAGTSGFLSLQTERRWYGTAATGEGFSATAQFFETVDGVDSRNVDVLDPLEGIDDCGVERIGSSGAGPLIELLDVERAVLHDDGTERVLEEFTSGADFFTYGVSLADALVAPRHGGSYGFEASGGRFGASIVLDGIVLPQALSIPELEQHGRFGQSTLDLTWTGRGSAPLKLTLEVTALVNPTGSIIIECRVADDGAFSIPGEVLQAVPEGLVHARFARENRTVQSSGGRSIQTIAAAYVEHQFVLGPACDGAASMAACRAGAEVTRAAYEACGAEVPPLATLCPDYLNEACNTCPEYFECVARATRCDEAGLSTFDPGCSCP